MSLLNLTFTNLLAFTLPFIWIANKEQEETLVSASWCNHKIVQWHTYTQHTHVHTTVVQAAADDIIIFPCNDCIFLVILLVSCMKDFEREGPIYFL